MKPEREIETVFTRTRPETGIYEHDTEAEEPLGFVVLDAYSQS